MNHEQFCRYLLLYDAIPQSLLTLSMRRSIALSATKRTQLLQSLHTAHQQWSHYKHAIQAECVQAVKQTDQLYTQVITLKRHGA
jgi:hypothetical protein